MDIFVSILEIIIGLCIILGFIFLFAVIIGYPSYRIIKWFKSKFPEKYYGGTVYSAKLISITEDIEVYIDLSREENIFNAKTQYVEKILVQETSNKYYYREILTGKLIPASFANKHIIDDDFFDPEYEYEYRSYKHCVFLEFIDRYKNNNFWRIWKFQYRSKSPLEEISSTILEDYIATHTSEYKGFNSFGEYLDFIFARGEKFYKDSEAKGHLSDSKLIEDILKNLKS